MNRDSNRSMLFAVVGGYLIYLAYELFQSVRADTPTTMPKWLMIVIIILFAGIGAALIWFAWKVWRKSREGKEEDRVEITEEEDGKTGGDDSAEK